MSALARAVQEVYGADNEIFNGIGGFQSSINPPQALASLQQTYGDSEDRIWDDAENWGNRKHNGLAFVCVVIYMLVLAPFYENSDARLVNTSRSITPSMSGSSAATPVMQRPVSGSFARRSKE